ncbi:McrB family protein [Persephonella sp.]
MNNCFPKNRPEFDWEVYKYLIKTNKKFRPKTRKEKNKECELFRGTKNKIYVSPYKGGSRYEKTPLIFVTFEDRRNEKNCYIEFIYDKELASNELETWPPEKINEEKEKLECKKCFMENLRSKLEEKGFQFKIKDQDKFKRFTSKLNTNSWQKAIDFFWENIKPIVDELIKTGLPNCPDDCNFREIFEISDEEFEEWKQKVEERIKEHKCFEKNSSQQAEKNQNLNSIEETKHPLNFILYGPPGTGKTYNTIRYAVAVIENKPVEELENEIKKEIEKQTQENLTEDKIREKVEKEIKRRFEQYKSQGQIVFTTFHPSYAYEDFVEGLKAETNNGQVEYYIEDGVFKDICEKAKNNIKLPEKIGDLKVNVSCENIELINQKDQKIIIPKELINDFLRYINNDENKHNEILKLLSKDEGNIGEQIVDKIKTKYLASFIKRYQNHIKVILENIKPNTDEKSNYVLIIDEINRGNIPSIFGELITLIEEDKRLGNDLGFTVKLPYSKKDFGVPKNLYIIGTMNTADRSIALLDIALRRRFEFIEMMPQPEQLEGIKVKKDDGSECDIELNKLLEKINKEITKKLNRDHQIGHAYFMASAEDSMISLKELNRIFKNKIIPLLQEYFYDEWDKIKEVLNDEKGRFIDDKDISQKLKNLNLTCDDFKCIYDNNACNGEQSTEDSNQTQENVENPSEAEEQPDQSTSETTQGEGT